MKFSEIMQLIRIVLHEDCPWEEAKHGNLAKVYKDACREINSGNLIVVPEELPSLEEHLLWAEKAVMHGCGYPLRPLPPFPAAKISRAPAETEKCSGIAELERLYRSKVRGISLAQRIIFLRMLATRGAAWAKADIAALLPEWGEFLKEYATAAWARADLAGVNAAAAELNCEDMPSLRESSRAAEVNGFFNQLLADEKIAIAGKILQLMTKAGSEGDFAAFRLLIDGWQQEFASGNWEKTPGFPQSEYITLVKQYEDDADCARRHLRCRELENQLQNVTADAAQVDSDTVETVRRLCAELQACGGNIALELQNAVENVYRRAEEKKKAYKKRFFLLSSFLLCVIVLGGCLLCLKAREDAAFSRDVANIRNLQAGRMTERSAEALRKLEQAWPGRRDSSVLRELIGVQRSLEETENLRISAFNAAAEDMEKLRSKGYVSFEEAYRVLEVMLNNAVTGEETAYCDELLEEILAAESRETILEQEALFADIAGWQEQVSNIASDTELTKHQKIIKLSALHNEFSEWIFVNRMNEEAETFAGNILTEINAISKRLNEESSAENRIAMLENELLLPVSSADEFIQRLKKILPEIREVAPDWADRLAAVESNFSCAAETAAPGRMPETAAWNIVGEIPAGSFWRELAEQVSILDSQLVAEAEEIKKLAVQQNPPEELVSLQFIAEDGRIYEFFLVDGFSFRYDADDSGEFLCYGIDGAEKLCRFRRIPDTKDWWFEHSDRLEIKLKNVDLLLPCSRSEAWQKELESILYSGNIAAVKAALAGWMGRNAADKNINPVLWGWRFSIYREFLLPDDPDFVGINAVADNFAVWFAGNGKKLYDLSPDDFRVGKELAAAVDWDMIAEFWRNISLSDRRAEILAWDKCALDMRWQLAGCEIPLYSGDTKNIIFAAPDTGWELWRMSFADSQITLCEYAGKWGGASLLDYVAPGKITSGTASFLFAGGGGKSVRELIAGLSRDNGECPPEALSLPLWSNIK